MSATNLTEPEESPAPERRPRRNRRRSILRTLIDRWMVRLGKYRGAAVLMSPYLLLFSLLWSGYLWDMWITGSDVAAGQAGATILWETPDTTHWFGIDAEGRDLMVRSMRAGASTATTALLAATMGIAAALFLTVPISFLGRRAVSWSMRVVTSLTSCFPAFFLALVFAAGLGAGFWPTVFILAGIIMLYAVASVVRWLEEVENDGHVISTRVLGLRRSQVLKTAVWPLLWPRLVALSVSALPAGVLAEAALSFAGFGIGSRDVESLGTVIADGHNLMFEAPWLVIYPGIALTLVALSLASLAWVVRALVGEGTNPRLF